MEKAMKKLLPDGASLPPLSSIDYSFAIEYSGPLPSSSIPKAIPIEIEEIPVASIATLDSPLDSLPVVQPLPFAQDLINSSSSELKDTAGGGRISTDSSLISDDFDDFDSSPSLEEQRVTFQETDGSSSSPTETRGEVRDIKKGCCFRCLKGGWFTEKEVCLVCDARYCGYCVLRAMGSMPEGRKCVTCIGGGIEDSKRERLGKSSRLLKRLLSSLEVEQVMMAEKYCKANQLRAEDVCVNRKQLTQEEMMVLQSCKCPPPKLKPGYYWYDKVSGFWGKVNISTFFI